MSFFLNLIMLLMTCFAANFIVKNSPVFSNRKIKYPFIILLILPPVKMTFFSKISLESIGGSLEKQTEIYFIVIFGCITVIVGMYVLYTILKILTVKNSNKLV